MGWPCFGRVGEGCDLRSDAPGERRAFRRVDTPGKGRIRQNVPQTNPGELNGVRIALGGRVGKRGW